MKASRALALGLIGAFALAGLLPQFEAAQPRGLSVTRPAAVAIATAEARRLGIPVGAAFRVETWEDSPLLEQELSGDAALRTRMERDPVVGPRLGGYRVTWFRPGLEKFPEFGSVVVGVDGTVLGARARARAEEKGGKPTEAQVRSAAERFVASRAFPGAPGPVLDSVRPTVLKDRADHLVRFRVPHDGPPASVSFFLNVYFVGEELAGWELFEEYGDGRAFRYELGGTLTTTFVRFAVVFGILFLLLGVFLRKYHAGEVGVGTGAWLFAGQLVLFLVLDVLTARADAYGFGFAGTDAFWTTVSQTAFRFLFLDVPLATLVFLSWSVGESYARERWGERLASFDALLRRDARNATVGESLLTGLLLSPAVAAAALLPFVPALALGGVRPVLGDGAYAVLVSEAGPATAVLGALSVAVPVAVVGGLLALSVFHRRHALWAGFLVSAVVGSILAVGLVPVGPETTRFLLGFGAPLAAAGVFLAKDLLASAVSFFGATLLLFLVPLSRAFEGPALHGTLAALALPLLLLLALALAGLATGRRVEYRHEDLAPHVKRIVERERVKAEIDAANRIQAALLPPSDPKLPGVVVASHYRAATEIGGDYFDFLPLAGGRIGLAFGDVAGHGLTSGIVMAMTKSALLVQTGHDPSPVKVMEVLNETVRKTAPKRMLMTFFFGVLDPATGNLRYCSAGHLDPYVVRAGGERLDPLSAWGFPLGVRRREPFVEHVARLHPGDRLVLYSDGLIEALDDDGEPFGFSRFEEVLTRAARDGAGEIRQALLTAVRRFTRNRPPEDDQTLVVLSLEVARAAEEAVA
ncbi:MAG TPA: PP2C family protein-serine/threonine phosphatase [Thermoanaerobaculia bacterium]|nr:PP2C family protein-serine/threonine phosphatase [Thermoanaerobaculia bacterium]